MGLPAVIAGVLVPAAVRVALDAASGLINSRSSGGGTGVSGFVGQANATGVGPGGFPTFPVGSQIDIQSQGFPPGTKFEVDASTGEVKILKRRRRRKRLLTCSDKADIAFVVGNLGKGAMGQAAVSGLLSRCS